MKDSEKNILIISDIEGSSGCWSYQASSFLTRAWRKACVDMTKDVNAVVKGLFEAGVERITVKDFHRTGYNILPEGIDSRARVVSGYRRSPVPGVGSPGNATAVMYLGLHAASGTDGFLAHTMTSRISRLAVNGKLLSEVELFSASLAPYGLRPIFFSGCPVACNQAQAAIKGIRVHPIDKRAGPEGFDDDGWRSELVKAAVASLRNDSTTPYMPEGPFRAVLTLRDGKQPARKIARRWALNYKEDRIFVDAGDIHELYVQLIRICYLTPLTESVMPLSLFVYHLWGRIGLEWVRMGYRRKAGKLTY
ncbi:M55 family metallopeptidase [Thermodesulfobacteriota bacterium]